MKLDPTVLGRPLTTEHLKRFTGNHSYARITMAQIEGIIYAVMILAAQFIPTLLIAEVLANGYLMIVIVAMIMLAFPVYKWINHPETYTDIHLAHGSTWIDWPFGPRSIVWIGIDIFFAGALIGSAWAAGWYSVSIMTGIILAGSQVTTYLRAWLTARHLDML